jgi:hypothetical protein
MVSCLKHLEKENDFARKEREVFPLEIKPAMTFAAKAAKGGKSERLYFRSLECHLAILESPMYIKYSGNSWRPFFP